MFERISTGWELAKQSVRILRLDKELILLPIMSGIACLLEIEPTMQRPGMTITTNALQATI